MTDEQLPAVPNMATAIGFAAESFELTPSSLGEVVAFARVMATAGAAIPQFLRGSAGDCLAVSLRALRWGMDPFAVASQTYKVKDIIAYEAQILSAVVNTRANLKERPLVEYKGEGDTRQCIVTMVFKTGEVRVYESPVFLLIQPKNSPLWKSDPDQQLSYYSIRAAARRYCPEVLLGVMDREEAASDMVNVTPAGSGLAERLAAEATPVDAAGFQVNRVAEAIEGTAEVVKPARTRKVAEPKPEPEPEPTTETVVEPAQEAEPEVPVEEPSPPTSDASPEPGPTDFKTEEAVIVTPAFVAAADRVEPADAAAAGTYYHFIGDRVNSAGQRPFYDAEGTRKGFAMKEHGIRVCRSLDGQGRACTWDGADIDAIASQAAPEPAPEPAGAGAFGEGAIEPLTNLDIYQNAIWAADDWAGLEAAIKALYATPEWKAADRSQRSGLYRMAYERVIEGGPFACGPGTNPTAFAVFVAGHEDSDQIQRTFTTAMVMPWYKEAAPATQQTATRMVLDRVEELKAQ